MATGYAKLSDKPFESHYLYFEQVIDAPIAKVWPQAINIGAWMNDYDLVHLDGEIGAVNYFEKVMPRDIPNSTPQPHHHYYGIAHVVPYRLIGLEVFREAGGSYGKSRPGMSFDTILFSEVGEQTRVAFSVVDVMLDGRAVPERPAEQKAEHDGTPSRLDRYFRNLEVLAAS